MPNVGFRAGFLHHQTPSEPQQWSFDEDRHEVVKESAGQTE